MEKTLSVIGVPFQDSTLAATQVVVGMNQAPLPCTVTLSSTAGGRLIEVSTDDGVNWFAPPLDVTQTNFINVAIKAPVSNVRITGNIGDRWSIR